MASTHPSEQLIALYASGEASEGASLAVAAHLTYCPACRARVVTAEAVASALMFGDADGVVTDVAAPNFNALLARLSEVEDGRGAVVGRSADQTIATTVAIDAGPLPAPVAAMVSVDFAKISWRFRLPGVSEYVLASTEGDSISLLRVRPGVVIPQHTHDGEELTVVFSGVLEDGDTSYGVGAMSIADHDVDHHPRAGGAETCICLAVVSGGLRFTGAFGRALNFFS
jgi:putative transcriptional regulator